MDPNIPTQPNQPESPVSQPMQVSSVSSQSPLNSSVKPPNSKKKLISLVLLFIIVISVSITVYALKQQQETRSSASVVVSEDTVIATINGENITKGDLRKVAEEQYKASAVDNNALNAVLDTIVERKALELEVKSGNVSASNDEIAMLVKGEGIDQQSAYFRVLVNKVTLRYTNARKALTIDFWVPPPEELATYEEADKAEYAKKLSDGLLALDEAKTRMEKGEDIAIITKSLSDRYLSISSILAVNGFILSDSEADLELVSQPKTYGVEETTPVTTFFTALFANTLKVGDVQKVLGEDQTGATVFKLLEKNDNPQYTTYKDWLKARKDQVLIIRNPLL